MWKWDINSWRKSRIHFERNLQDLRAQEINKVAYFDVELFHEQKFQRFNFPVILNWPNLLENKNENKAYKGREVSPYGND